MGFTVAAGRDYLPS